MINYEYEKLLNNYKNATDKQKALEELALWLSLNDSSSWNGEYYSVEGFGIVDDFRIFRLYDDTEDMNIIGYEAR